MSRPGLITLKDAARFNGESYRNAKRRAEQGRRLGLIHPEAHPTDARLKLYPVAHLLTAEGLARWSREKKNGNGALALFPLAAPESDPSAAGLAPGERDLALQRYRIIEPILNGTWEKFRGQRMADGRALQSKRDFVQWLAAQRDLCPSTLWEWRARYMKDGLPGLRRQPRSDKKHFATLYGQDEVDLVQLFKTEGSARGACREFQYQKQRSISYQTALAIVNRLPQAMRDGMQCGRKWMVNHHAAYIELDRSKMRPNDVWVADHTRLDFFVNAWGAAVRPWITIFLDRKSRLVVGWCLSLQPDSGTIASALRMAIAQHGLPKSVLFDNGKDFRARYLTREGRQRSRRLSDYRRIESAGGADFPEEARSGVLDRFGIAVRYSLPYHPQSKGDAERFFRTLHEQFDRNRFNSYCGRNPASRPEEWAPLIRRHREAVKAGQPEDSPLPTIGEATALLESWLTREYHQQPHSGQGMNRRSPVQVYKDSPHKVPPEALALLFLDQDSRVVEHGAVRVFGLRYEAPGLEWHNTHNAQIAFDRHRRAFGDLGEVLAYCCGQSFVCRHLGQPQDGELRDRIKGNAGLLRGYDEAVAGISARSTVVGSGERSRRELRSALPPALDPRAPAVAAKRLPAPRSEPQRFANERFADLVAKAPEVLVPGCGRQEEVEE